MIPNYNLTNEGYLSMDSIGFKPPQLFKDLKEGEGKTAKAPIRLAFQTSADGMMTARQPATFLDRLRAAAPKDSFVEVFINVPPPRKD